MRRRDLIIASAVVTFLIILVLVFRTTSGKPRSKYVELNTAQESEDESETQSKPQQSRQPACINTWKLNNMKSQQLVQSMLSIAIDGNRFKNSYPGLTIFDPFEPQWTCPFELRVGKDFGDGGKFVCGTQQYFRSKPDCLVYSIGSSGDFSFEIDVIRRYGRKCEIHTFDPTGDSAAWTEQGKQVGTNFHPWGLSHVDASNRNNALLTQSNPMMQLGNIVEKLGHLGRTIDILKVDCEGCEFDAFKSIWKDVSANKFKIGQIQIEVHKNDHEADVPVFFAEAARAGFDLFHKERNHWGCLGWTCLEFSFISAEAKRDIYAHDICPEILQHHES